MSRLKDLFKLNKTQPQEAQPGETRYQSLRILKSQSGMALMLAIFSVVLIVYIVQEVTYETNIEYLVNAKAVHRVKAYYAAKSGVELSLIRIKIFNQIQAQYGENLKNMGAMSKMVDMIWQMPFVWPPIIPGEVNAVDKEDIEKKIKESTMDGVYQTTIIDEGTKIDINDLDSPSKGMRDTTRRLLLKIFESKKETDEVWAKTYSNFQPEELVNNITDWIDADRESLNGGPESRFYQDMKDLSDLNIQYPPNRHFRSLEELRFVGEMTEEFYKLLAPSITIYGSKAINPNTAPQDLIRALDRSIDDKVMEEFNKRRNDPELPPFVNRDEFWSFMEAHGARIPQETIETTPLVFTKATNFRIRSLGEYKGAVRQIEAVVFDMSQTTSAVADNYKKENKPDDPNDPGGKSGTPAAGPRPNQSPSKGPPRIVYWTEN